MFDKFKNAAKDLTKSALSTVGIPVVTKTKDPLYTEAKNSFKILCGETEKVVGSLSTLQSRISQISRLSEELSANYTQWVKDLGNEERINQAITLESFGKQFENLSNNFLKPRAEFIVIRPLALLQAEIMRLSEIKLQRKEAVKKYDSARAKLKMLEEQKSPKSSEIAKATEETNDTKKVYDELNTSFISGVRGLSSSFEEKFAVPIRNLVAVFSQYMMQIFAEAQKFRTTFPAETINNTPKPGRSIKDIVFAD